MRIRLGEKIVGGGRMAVFSPSKTFFIGSGMLTYPEVIIGATIV